MKKNSIPYLTIYNLILSLCLYLIFHSSNILAENFDSYTVVTVVEGKTVVFEYPEVTDKKLETGIFKHLIKEDTAYILIKFTKHLAYLTSHIKEKYLTVLKPYTPILLQEGYRSEYGTSWDIIDVGLIVKKSQEYAKGEIYQADFDKIESLRREADTLRAYIQAVYATPVTETTGTEKVISTVAQTAAVISPPIPEEPTVPVTTTTTTTETTTETTAETKTFFWVDPVNGQDTTGRDGSNISPWKTITFALTQISTGTINCVAGTYSTGSGETFPINMKSNITLSGAGSSSTIISASGSGTRVISCSSISSASIRSLQVTGGTGVATGGGILIQNSSSITISSCNININASTTDGGGIYIDSTSTGITVSSTNIYSNTSRNGAGIDIVLSSNTVSVTSSNIYSNTANDYGGGIYISYGAGSTGSVTFTSANVYSNSLTGLVVPTGGGGGFYIEGIAAAPEACTISFTKCSIYSNSIDAAGPYLGAAGFITNTGTTSVTFTNNLVYSNDSNANNGNGIYCSTSSGSFINCTFASNGDNTASGSIHVISNSDPTVSNCIFSQDSGYGIYEDDITSDPAINSNDFSGNTTAMLRNEGLLDIAAIAILNALPQSNGANIDGDPLLKGGGDYRIGAGSPCINAGTAAGAPSDDFSGRTRSGLPDIGAYEYITGDPAITGKVYDSIAGETISSPTIAIYKADTTTALSTTTSNPYSFNVDPGKYYIAVTKDGYGFPSQILPSVVPGDHGDEFTAGDTALTIDIPMDNDGYLVITKTANKKQVNIGEIITYNIKIENKHWFRTIQNVVIEDELTNGFKFIPGSTYLGRAKQLDPDISNHKAKFNLGAVQKNTTLNLSYQVRVGTGIVPGRYKTSAIARNSSTNKQVSNISSTEIEVISDPIFDLGTIIGKVFWDEDGDGIQSHGEIGMPYVELATEYGLVVKTDVNGKFHIPNIHPGTHLVKIDPSSLPKGLTVSSENPYFVKITPGLMAKANFTLKLKEQVEEKEDKFFIVALGEGIVRNINTSGNIDMVEKDDSFDDGIAVDGRLSLYLKGKILGKYLITASLDTDRLPGEQADQRKLFTNLDPDKYYPIYGDASELDYTATDTQDILYLLIEWDKSMLKWGSFHTGIPLYSRTLSGGNIHYQSIKKTKFEQPYTKIQGFYAVSRQLPAHDEFAGTGGSLYYLSHTDIIEGSEKLKVEIRERISKTPIITIPLVEEKDYTIDYQSGKIILTTPLNLVNQSYISSIISNDILAGERVYLVVDYEYLSNGMSNESSGMRISQWIGSHIRVGETYVKENKEPDPYLLRSLDGTIKVNQDTEINATYSRSDETQLGGNISYTGGVTFTEKSDTFADGEHGNSVKIDGKTKIFKNTNIDLSYSRQDPFYSATDSLTTQGTQKYIALIKTQLTENTSARVQHVTQKLLENDGITSGLTGNTSTHTTTAMLDYNPPYPQKWDWRLEYQHQEVSNPITQFTYLGQLQFQDNDFLAGRLGYQLTPRIHPYVRGQGTLSGSTNNQATLGTDLRLWDTTSLSIAETAGNLGNSTLIGVTSINEDGTETYANIETGNNILLGRYTRSTYGQASKLSPDARAYIEEDYSTYQENLIRSNLLGYDRELTDTTSLGFTYERSFVENDTKIINRDSIGGKLSYLNTDYLRLSTSLEYRDDRNTSDTLHQIQWLTKNNLHWYITKNLSTYTKLIWSISEDKETKEELAEFYDTGFGLAYRPVNFDRLNLLAKYNYITDLRPESQNDFPETLESIKNVYAIEGIFDLTRYLQLIGKFALRDMSERVGPRDWVSSNTYLYIARTNLQITTKWDIAGEYRILTNPDSEDSKAGWLFEIDYNLGDYMRFGVGYNFTDYDDDLSDEDDWDAKGWFVRVNGKY